MHTDFNHEVSHSHSRNKRVGQRVMWNECKQYLGIATNTTSHGEKLISLIGGFFGILAVFTFTQLLVAQNWLDLPASYLVVTSMGASAVLLFVVPHGALAQPWAVIGGHVLSALIGVTAATFLGTSAWVGAFAVGSAIGLMYYARCIHPPGGATALTAVVGGASVTDLGYSYLIIPILANVLIILIVAIVFNAVFTWRRYPAHLAHKLKPILPTSSVNTQAGARQFELTQEDFAAAMQELDSFVDITTDGLIDLLELAKQHAEKNITHPDTIIAGHIYSNGKLGQLWSIRQVIDAGEESHPEKDRVIYKVLAGHGNYETGICLRSEFRQWARFEVEKHNSQWVKVDSKGQ